MVLVNNKLHYLREGEEKKINKQLIFFNLDLFWNLLIRDNITLSSCYIDNST